MKKRKFSIFPFLLFAAAFFPVTLFPNAAFAFTGEVFSPEKVESWCQYRYPGLSDTLLRNGGLSVGKGSCGYFALTSAARKEGTAGDNYTPENLISLAKEKGLQNNWWGHFNFEMVTETGIGLRLPDSEKKELFGAIRGGTEGIDDYYWQVPGSLEEQIAVVKTLYQNGYYVLACVTNNETDGHYVFIDYVDDEERVRITDSGFPGTWLDEKYTASDARISYLVILESENGRGANHQKSVYDFDESSQKFNRKIEEEKKKEEEKKRNEEIQALFFRKAKNLFWKYKSKK